MKKQKYLMYISLPLIVFIVLYIMVGFVYLDLNANNWPDIARTIIVGLVFLFGIIEIFYIVQNDDDVPKL